MHIELTHPGLAEFVEDQVKQGRFNSPAEVVQGALALLRANDSADAEEFEELRKEIQLGLDELDRGESAPWDRAEIEREVERRLAEEQGNV